jgi:hypothetical protein
VITLLVDANIDGHVKLLLSRLVTEKWKLFSDALGLQFRHLEDVGLNRKSPDDVVWRLCQENGYYLLTANRRMQSDDSLEATIRREGTAESLPVFTLADSDRLYESAEYLEKVVESLLDRLMSVANYLGVGRVYLP